MADAPGENGSEAPETEAGAEDPAETLRRLADAGAPALTPLRPSEDAPPPAALPDNAPPDDAPPGDAPPPERSRGPAAPRRPIASGAVDPDRSGRREPVVGVALGAGAARGWSHIGVLEALEEIGVRPSIVVGCSSGAVVGAAYSAGALAPMKDFATALTWRGMLGYFDFSWRGGGLIEGRWLTDFFQETIGDHAIEALPLSFGSVATELSTGRETWFTRGSLLDAVRASIALPGLITPVAIDGRWMVDGALANPIPVSLCRALGAEVIIGVSMNGDLVSLGRSPLALAARADASLDPSDKDARFAEPEPLSLEDPGPSRASPATAAERRSSWLAWLTGYGGGGWSSYWAGESAATANPEAAPTDRSRPTPPPGRPGYFDVIGQSFFSTQNFISRVRLAADPVDVLVVPAVEGIGIMDFHRGAEAIEIGRQAVAARADLIKALCQASESANASGS
ncbi:MAG: patatin-like phospholipase family protein [Pseudomonadota bacterium]